MRLSIESTGDLVSVRGVVCRRWIGKSDDGVECEVFVHRVAVREDLEQAEFARELLERPREHGALPGRPA